MDRSNRKRYGDIVVARAAKQMQVPKVIARTHDPDTGLYHKLGIETVAM